MDTSPYVFESQLDWLTMARHSRRGADELRRAAERAGASEISDGAKVRPFRLNGYQGWQAGRVRYGERENAGLVQLSGDLADRLFESLWPTADNVSRIDLAVTVRLPELNDLLGERHYCEALLHYAHHQRGALPSKVCDAKGGTTVYLGDRSSDHFLRVYNKQRECEAHHDDQGAERYRSAWRYELELKGISAPAAATQLAYADDRPAAVQAWVYGYVTQHGIVPPFDAAGGQELKPGFRRRSDRESKLAWLDRSVRPAVRWLLETGDRTDVLERLGLVDLELDGHGPRES